MLVASPVDVSKLLLESSSFGSAEVAELLKAVAANPREVRQQYQQLTAKLGGKGSERDLAAAGIAAYCLARPTDAVEHLCKVKKNGWADFYRGCAYHSLGQHSVALQAFQDAEKNGYDPIDAVLAQAGETRLSGKLEEAEKLLKAHSRNAVSRAEYSYQMGCVLADRGDIIGAIEYFERAVDMDPKHSSALFRLAAINAQHGNDEEAIHLYERCLSRPPFFIEALLNLGLLYEDMERFDCAAFCFRRVLDVDSNHPRAQLYLKDIEATGQMFYDEEQVKQEREQEQVLNTPINDFELSARSRNCLERLGIKTVGDLTRISEPELLASRNFGETSLKEVKTILESKGLTIGENVVDKKAVNNVVRREDLPEEKRSLFDSSVSELNLSVRSRKCLSRLGINLIGELLNKTPDELLSIRNFGVTSLNEIRGRLTEMGVSLRND